MHALSTSDEMNSRIALAVSAGTGNAAEGFGTVWWWFDSELAPVTDSGTQNSGTIDRSTRRATPQHLPSRMLMACMQKSSRGSAITLCIKQNLRREGCCDGETTSRR